MWQRKRPKPLREQLTDALNECRRQLQVLYSPRGEGYGNTRRDNRREIEMLEAEQRRLREALESLDPADGQTPPP